MACQTTRSFQQLREQVWGVDLLSPLLQREAGRVINEGSCGKDRAWVGTKEQPGLREGNQKACSFVCKTPLKK